MKTRIYATPAVKGLIEDVRGNNFDKFKKCKCDMHYKVDRCTGYGSVVEHHKQYKE